MKDLLVIAIASLGGLLVSGLILVIIMHDAGNWFGGNDSPHHPIKDDRING